MRRIFPVWMLVACGGAVTQTSPQESTPSPPSGEPAAELRGVASSGEGWGVVFWKDSVAFKIGGGMQTIGPRGRTVARLREPAARRCGGLAIDDAAPHAVVTLPEGKTGDVPSKPAVISASTVEAAAWRLDESLPGRDRFTPVDPDAAPALQRGVEVGSVIKVRRYGGPPVVVVGGRRGENGGLLVVDHAASMTLARALVDGFAETPRVLPPTDLDGDGHLETALFTDERVVLARLKLTPSTVELHPLESWSCGADAATP